MDFGFQKQLQPVMMLLLRLCQHFQYKLQFSGISRLAVKFCTESCSSASHTTISTNHPHKNALILKLQNTEKRKKLKFVFRELLFLLLSFSKLVLHFQHIYRCFCPSISTHVNAFGHFREGNKTYSAFFFCFVFPLKKTAIVSISKPHSIYFIKIRF